MSVAMQNRTICKYNLRGQCRFGKRCRNIHEDPDRIMECFGWMNSIVPQNQTQPTNQTNQAHSRLEGACSQSPSKTKSPRKTLEFTNKQSSSSSNSVPSTSSIQKSLSILSLAETEEEKTCGICFDVVLKKSERNEQTFGMLPNCSHCFCFTCIRKWRQSKEFELDVSKACPECRVPSEFVYPTKYWMENKEDKEKYITKQKQRMKLTDCRYFRKGKGKCPFGNTCMFLHALENGQEFDVGPPKPRRRSPGTFDDLMHQIVFWLNDEEFDIESEDEDEDVFDLDLDDPCIALQYYERGDIRRYIAWERLMEGDFDDDSDSDMNTFIY